MKEDNSLYPGTQEDLYAISTAAWHFCSENITHFSSLKAKYTTTFINNALTALEAAKVLPNVEVRGSTIKALRVSLTAAAALCRAGWQSLDFFIGGSFSPELAPIMRQAAGGNLYRSASGGNWQATDTMLTLATTFMEKYADALQDGDMPADFATEFAANYAAFTVAWNAYGNAKKSIEKDTAVKIKANNAVYTAVTAMLKDGKHIFRNDPKMKKLFTYSSLRRLFTKGAKTGFRIVVKDSTTLSPVTTTTFIFQPGNIRVVLNEAGIAEVHLPKGIYSFTATTPGYNTIMGNHLKATAGVMHRKELLLSKAESSAAVA